MTDIRNDWMWSEACEMVARAERMHREFFRPIRTAARVPAWEPPVDVLETDREVLVFFALPGVDPDHPAGGRPAGAASGVADRDHPSSGIAARPLREAGAVAGGTLRQCPPVHGQWLSADHPRERDFPWLSLKICAR